MDIELISKRMSEEVENMTIPELKAVLAKHNLETTGKRADLVARLSNYYKQNGEKVTDGAKSVKASPKIASKSPKAGPKGSKAAPAVSAGATSEAAASSSPKVDPKEAKSPSSSHEAKKEVTEMTMEERLALRAKRFNIENPVKTVKKSMKLVLDEDPELLKKRSERFGIPLVKQKSNEQTPKKKIDFVVDEEELLKRKKRLERFG